MKSVNIINQTKLESTLEKYIKEAYNEKDYLRCKNLVNYLLRVNKENSVWLYYNIKLTPSLLKKAKYQWVWFRTWSSILRDWKLYAWLSLLRLWFSR